MIDHLAIELSYLVLWGLGTYVVGLVLGWSFLKVIDLVFPMKR